MNKNYQQVRRWYYNAPINRRLNLTNILIIIVPMVVFAFVANKISSDIIIEKSVASSTQELGSVARSLTSLLKQMEYLSKLTATNQHVQAIINLPADQLPAFLERRIDVIGSLDDIVGNKDIISAETIVTLSGYVVTSSNVDTARFLTASDPLTSSAALGQLRKGEVRWQGTQPIAYFSDKKTVNGLSLYRALLNRDSGEAKGTLKIDVDQTIFAHLLPADSPFGDAFIMNDQGLIVSTPNGDRLYQSVASEPYFQWIVRTASQNNLVELADGGYLVTSLTYAPLGWHIVRLVPLRYLTEDSSKVTALIVTVVLICIALASLASFLNARAITRPIIRLANDMSDAGQGDMEVRSANKNRDEIGELANSFNTMMDRIVNLMDRVYREQKKKREFELMALQSQINPHFLYNTLESVCSLAILNRNEDVVQMVKALAMFYRSVLSKGRNVVTIREEIESIRHYLLIQKIRYGDKFDYEIEVAPDILDKSSVKLTLQPLVENALYHGIKQKSGKGTITVTGIAENGHIRLSIIDDGIGFVECGAIQQVIDSRSEGGSSYGLRNVNERIKLYFGPEYGTHITSQRGHGTTVDVLLPIAVYEDSQLEYRP